MRCAAAPATLAEAGSLRGRKAGVITGAIRIVLVDDDDGIATLLRVNFELDRRFELVARGRDGTEALALVREHEPDAVLMDVQMPVLDGIAATELLVEADPDVCVVAFTASPDPAVAAAVLAAGAIAVLGKPFDPEAFLDALAAHAAACAA